MDNDKKNLITFCISTLIAFIYWRITVYVRYRHGTFSFLREITGLAIHHYHWGVLLLTFSLLFYLFYSQNKFVVAGLGFGLGSMLDSLISSLIISDTRMQEIITYNSNIFLSGIIILAIISLAIALHLLKKK